MTSMVYCVVALAADGHFEPFNPLTIPAAASLLAVCSLCTPRLTKGERRVQLANNLNRTVVLRAHPRVLLHS
jgi:hypothetical protein